MAWLFPKLRNWSYQGGRNTTLTITGRRSARSCQARSHDDLYRNREARTYLNARLADGGRLTEAKPVGSGSIAASAQDKDEWGGCSWICWKLRGPTLFVQREPSVWMRRQFSRPRPNEARLSERKSTLSCITRRETRRTSVSRSAEIYE